MVSRREPYEFRADEDSTNPPAQEPVFEASNGPVENRSNRVKDRNDVKVFNYKHAIPVHTSNVASILAKDAPPQSYRGFLTLAMLVLLATNIRLVVENFLKYGVLIALPSRSISDKDWGLFSLVHGFLQFNVLLSLLIEKMVSRSNGSVMWVVLHWANIGSVIVVPTYTVYFVMFHPLVGGAAMSLSIILSLKLTSFLLVNSDLRRAYFANNGDKVPTNSVEYPNNLTLANYYYFMVAPTLCYQISYPRSESIRTGFVLKRLAECFMSNLFTYFLVVQYAIPTLRNASSTPDGTPPSPMFVIERVLKLSTISVTVWLLGFYSLFHSFLNAAAELLRFGDRNFYQPWWNSSSLSQYWRLWNQPVHHWMKRHLYVPGVSAGYPGWFMLGITFLFSAIFHELLFGVAVHSIQGYAFWGMLAQIPLIMLTSLLVKWRGPTSSAGNVVFWLSFCILGQPFLVVLYYYDWTRRNPAVVPSSF